jgi:hypothetical protein
MDDLFSRAWHDILARPSGPMAIRFYLQPLVAIAFAVRDGRKDARGGRPAYFWSLFTDRSHRRERLREGWRSVGKVFIFAFVLDTVYQLVVLKGIRPVEGLIVAALLAFLPYLVFRGPVNRIARRLGRAGSRPDSTAHA